MEGCCILAYFPWLIQLVVLHNEGHLSRVALGHISQEKAVQSFLQDPVDEGIVSVEITSSQMILTWVELTKSNWHRGPAYDILA